jgi:hypothetical protein
MIAWFRAPMETLPVSRAPTSALRSLLVVLPILAIGCSLPPVHRAPAKLDPKPYLLHLPGVGGGNFLHRQYLAALGDGGFDAEMEIIDWRRHHWPISALHDYDANRHAAERIAHQLVERRRAEPDRPIYLSAESGGAGVATWVLEALPDDGDPVVDAALLISPALSRDYDLTPALRRVRTKMLVFTSRNDTLVLGLGTSLFGTMDGRREVAAGMVGFRRPPGADVAQYAKLEQHAFGADWFWSHGQLGGHASALGARFASARIAPLLVGIARQLPGSASGGDADEIVDAAEPAASAGRTD